MFSLHLGVVRSAFLLLENSEIRREKMRFNTILGCLGLFVFTFTGCNSLGHNYSQGHSYSFMLQYKKDVRCFYAKGGPSSDDPKAISIRGKPHEVDTDDCKDRDVIRTMENSVERFEDAYVYLPYIFTTNLPFSITNHYDFRSAGQPIRQGDPLSIIINKVHLANNGEVLPWDTGEIAVVVTVEDGSDKRPQHVMVAYETGVLNNVTLPVSDLLAYHTDSYKNQSLRIEVTVFDLDKKENESYRKMLQRAAILGASYPPAAAAFSLATEIGNQLIDENYDDIIVSFKFLLYPWKPGQPKLISDEIGVPKLISAGHYLIARWSDPINREIFKRIHADWDLSVFELERNPTLPLPNPYDEKDCPGPADVLDFGHEMHNSNASKNKASIDSIASLKVRPWPISPDCDNKFWKKPLHADYIVLTVDSRPLPAAKQLLAHVNLLNQTISGLALTDQLEQDSTKLLVEGLDDMKSLAVRAAAENNFFKSKDDPQSLTNLFEAYANEKTNSLDQRALLHLIHTQLPPKLPDRCYEGIVPVHRLNGDITFYEKLYKRVKNCLKYDRGLGRYALLNERDSIVTCGCLPE